ncbi:hypothetical protein [Streptomyces milbemycinicus]
MLDESELAQELAEHRLALRLAGHPDLGQHVVSSGDRRLFHQGLMRK